MQTRCLHFRKNFSILLFMPFTLCHPAAITPLFSKRAFRGSALVIGAMAPDFGYYFPFSEYFNASSHTLVRSFTFCLPVGLFFWILFMLTRNGWTHFFPLQQQRLLKHVVLGNPIRLIDAALVPISILFGAWTHIIWDGFTHRNGWFVHHMPILQEKLIEGYRGYNLLQHLSTAGGAILLLWLYNYWLRRHGTSVYSDWKMKQLTFFSLAFLLPLAFALTRVRINPTRDLLAYREFAYEWAAASLGWSAGILFVAAAYFSSKNRDGKPQPS
jgi:hypothetical protein